MLSLESRLQMLLEAESIWQLDRACFLQQVSKQSVGQAFLKSRKLEVFKTGLLMGGLRLRDPLRGYSAGLAHGVAQVPCLGILNRGGGLEWKALQRV